MGNYWTLYHGGNRSRDFILGVIVGVKTFAIWKDGKQLVGALRSPLEQEIEEIKEGLGWKKEWDQEGG